MYPSLHRNGLTYFIVFLTLFFCLSQSHASQTVFLNQFNIEDTAESLVEYPDYGFTSATPTQGHAQKIREIFRGKNCEPTDFSFQKIEDPNTHPYFPQIQHNPVKGDHLGVFFFKEKKTGKYLLYHWPEQQIPITFHLTRMMEPYREWIQEVIDNLNQIAHKNNIVSHEKSLFELSDEIKSLRDESCDLHLIAGSTENRKTVMVTYYQLVTEVEERLGEIVDTDIVVYIRGEKKFHKENLKKGFQWDLTHELLHSLGLGHNFALSTVMSYDDSLVLKTDLKDILSEYEIDVLKYLFHHTRSSKPWALIRPEAGIENKEVYIPEGPYKLEPKEKNIVCKNSLDLTEKTFPTLPIIMNLKYDNHHGVDWINLTFSDFTHGSDWVPRNMESAMLNFGIESIDGNLDTSFKNKDPRFAFRPSFLDNLNNRFSAHIDTEFSVLEPQNPNHLSAAWDVKNELDQVIAECKLSTDFDLTRIE